MNAPTSVLASKFTEDQRGKVVREAYRKHAAELLAIEDAQQKLVLLLLGVFGAGASYLASEKTRPIAGAWPRTGLTILVVALMALAGVYTHRRNHARETVRNLLLRCDEALGFFEPGLYLSNEPLYPSKYQRYPRVGGWLGWTYWLAVIAGVGFLVVLWSPGL